MPQTARWSTIGSKRGKVKDAAGTTDYLDLSKPNQGRQGDGDTEHGTAR